TVFATSILESPQFSHEAGLYREPFTLELSAPAEGAVVRYTLDGTPPTEVSKPYAGPITIVSRAGDTLSRIRSGPPGDWSEWRGPSGDVFKATVVRASAFKDGAIASRPATA